MLVNKYFLALPLIGLASGFVVNQSEVGTSLLLTNMDLNMEIS